MKRILLLGIAALAAMAALFAALPYLGGPPQAQNISSVCFGQECFAVELALTPEQQAQGLMHRESLPPGSGMLFVFPQEGVYPFWMRNTLIPLDIIWMDSEGRVVFIAEDVQPCGQDPCPTVNPGKDAGYVLELNAGAAERMGLREGDYGDFSLNA